MKGLDLDLGIGRAKSICLFNIDLSSLDLIDWTKNIKCIRPINYNPLFLSFKFLWFSCFSLISFGS